VYKLNLEALRAEVVQAFAAFVLLQGTLDLLILRTLIFGSRHGQGIARAIQETPGLARTGDRTSLISVA
jgi:hypothetical protein